MVDASVWAERAALVERARREIFRRIMVEGLGQSLTAVAANGSKPVLVVQEHERLRDIMPRVSSAGGTANLFVVFDSGRIAGSSMQDGLAENADTALAGPDGVDADVEIGMIDLYARKQGRGVALSVRIGADSVEVQSTSQLALT